MPVKPFVAQISVVKERYLTFSTLIGIMIKQSYHLSDMLVCVEHGVACQEKIDVCPNSIRESF